MAVALNSGEVANVCDVDDFVAGGLDTDITIDGNGAIGEKTSNTTKDFVTPSLGSGGTSTYNFSSGGGEFGDHIIMWFDGLTPLNTTTGFRITVGETLFGNRGTWAFAPPAGYSGGWVPKVIDTAANFSSTTGLWTAGGNPGQLVAVDEMGGGFTTTTMISGNFANVLIDQFTVGTGLRIDGTGNDWDTIATAEGTNYWGWLVESFGNYILRGGMYLGPATGTTTSSFTDTSAVLLFADENVATGFYVIDIRGANTTVSFTQHIIRAENATNARWSLTLDASSVPTFDDDGSLFQGFDVITLQTGSTLDGTTLDNGNSIIQNNATITNCSILNANTADGVALITSDNPANISSCDFTFSDGHAIEIDTAGTYTFSGNTFNSYGADGTNDAAIYNNSGGAVTLNITAGGDTPTVRNGAGASTTLNNNVQITLSGIKTSGPNGEAATTEIRVYRDSDGVELDGIESAASSFVFSVASGTTINIVIHNLYYVYQRIQTTPTSDGEIPINQVVDRNYDNPA